MSERAHCLAMAHLGSSPRLKLSMIPHSPGPNPVTSPDTLTSLMAEAEAKMGCDHVFAEKLPRVLSEVGFIDVNVT